jgi:hypothetical protein
MFSMHCQEIIENYQKWSNFSNIIFFIDLLLPVSWYTSDYYTDHWRFISFSKTYNVFQSNWNVILFHMYNEIAGSKFQHFLYAFPKCPSELPVRSEKSGIWFVIWFLGIFKMS